MSPEHLKKAVLPTCALHNYLRDDADRVTTEADITGSPPTYAVADLRHIGGNTTDDALAIMDFIRSRIFFVSLQVAVDWQMDMIRKVP
jgi:hypothetical protein